MSVVSPTTWTAQSAQPLVLAAGLSFAGLLVLAFVDRVAGHTVLTAWAAVVILAAYIGTLLRRDLVTLFLLVPFLATLVPVVLSNLYIEHGGYISEQGLHGEPLGSTIGIVGYILVFVTVVQLVVCRAPRLRSVVAHVTPSRFARQAKAIHVAVLLGATVVLIAFGSPLVTGMDRFEYWSQLPEIFNRLPFLIALCCSASAISLVLRRKTDWTAVMLIGASVIVLLLFSEKFTGLYTALAYGIATAYTARLAFGSGPLRLGRLIALASAAIAILLVFATVGFMIFYGYDITNVLGKLIDRAFGLQGHVWYGVTRVAGDEGGSGDLSQLLPGSAANGWGGITMLMYEISPQDFVDRMVARNLRFAMGGPGLLMYVFGYSAGAIVLAIAGLVTGGVLYYLYFAIARLNVLSIFVGLYGIRIMINVLMLGDIPDLWKPLTWAYLAWVAGDVALHWVRRRRARPFVVRSVAKSAQ